MDLSDRMAEHIAKVESLSKQVKVSETLNEAVIMTKISVVFRPNTEI